MPKFTDFSTLVMRPSENADEAFLRDLYTRNRAHEFDGVAWTEGQRAAFLKMQFEARARSHAALPGLRQWIVELHGASAGTLSTIRLEESIRVVNIELRSEFANRGLGTKLLAGVIAEAGAAGLPVSLSVEKTNRALSLYRRLGFMEVGDDGVYMNLERPVSTDTHCA